MKAKNYPLTQLDVALLIDAVDFLINDYKNTLGCAEYWGAEPEDIKSYEKAIKKLQNVKMKLR